LYTKLRNIARQFAGCLYTPARCFAPFKVLLKMAAVPFLLTGFARADTLLSNIAASNFITLMTNSSAQEIGWHQDVNVSDLSITVPLASFSVGPADQGINAFLTNSIGPGTTVANQIASTYLPLASTRFPLTNYTLFSGLNLSPGDYYLTLAGTAVMGPGWGVNPTDTLAGSTPGFTFLSEGASTNPTVENGLSSYRPASTFFDIVPSASPAAYSLMLQLDGDVSPTSTPEPAELGLIGIGLTWLSLWLRGKRSRR
jgi:hypothetical protein